MYEGNSACMSMFWISSGAAQAAIRSLRPYGELVEFGFQPGPDARNRAQLAGRAQILVAGYRRIAVQDADRNRIDARGNGTCAIEIARVVLLLVPVDLGEARRD